MKIIRYMEPINADTKTKNQQLSNITTGDKEPERAQAGTRTDKYNQLNTLQMISYMEPIEAGMRTDKYN